VNRELTLAWTLGWQDIRQAYRRSALGPFWITLGMAVQITTMGLVFGQIFKSDIQEYLPFLGTSIILWSFIASSLNEGALAFISSEGLIKQIKVSPWVYVLRAMFKGILSLAHNIAILPLVFLVFLRLPGPELFLVLPGFFLFVINLTWIIAVISLISTRYRDFPPIINSLTTIAFFLTPVMWSPELLGDNQLAHLLLGLNPFYHLLQIVRLPILGQTPTLENWALTSVFAVLGILFTRWLLNKFQGKIAYWL
jgi:ABC-type polysaccharide/polyol phosphate export permease